MFFPQGGKQILVGEGFICNLPPLPEKHQIIGFDLPRSEQYWKRQEIPAQFQKLFKEEEERQNEDKILVEQGKKKYIFIDQALERYRRQEWARRLRGVYFMNDGEPVYLTNHHYFYLQWVQSDHPDNNGYPLFYEHSMVSFYIRQWCETNPRSYGYLFVGPRGTGKTLEELACILNRTTYLHKHKAALQTNDYEVGAMGDLIQAKLVPIFNSLPKFFKPEFAHGTNPSDELTFRRPKKGGALAKVVEFSADLDLNSTITAVRPGEKVLDKKTLNDILNDEQGKHDPAVARVDVRHEVNIKCVERNHRKVGVLRETTTVEEMTKGGNECHEIWRNSDPKMLDGNGFTLSKIHRHLISALDTDTSIQDYVDASGKNWGPPCNKYGKVNKEIANRKIQADLDAVKHDLAKMSGRMRKSPRNEAEAFIPDQSRSVFNIQLLTNRLNRIRNEMPKKPYIRGNFYWINKMFGPVWFERDDHAGRFNCAWLPDEYHHGIKEPGKTKIINNFKEEWGYDRHGNARIMITPGNDHLFRAATDPIKYTFTKDPRASKAAIHAFRLYDHMIDGGRPRSQWQSHNFIFEYCVRPDNPATYWEDLAMMCMFLGCTCFPERNVTDVNNYFESNGLEKLLAYPKNWVQTSVMEVDENGKMKEVPGGLPMQTTSDDAGLASSKEVIDYYTKRIIPFINQDINRMPFDDTCEDWSTFDPLNPTKSHLTVSSGFALVHAEKITEIERPPENKISDWFEPIDPDVNMMAYGRD